MELGNVNGAIPIHGFMTRTDQWQVLEANADGKAAWVTARLDAYKHALADENIEFDPKLLAEGDFTKKSGTTAIASLLDAQQRSTLPFDAVAAANDYMALGAMHELAVRAKAMIVETLRLEESRFRRTLDRGLRILDEETARLGAGDRLAGEVAFKLYDTYGFPLDLTQDIARERGMSVDTAGFDVAMEKQRETARTCVSTEDLRTRGSLRTPLTP